MPLTPTADGTAAVLPQGPTSLPASHLLQSSGVPRAQHPSQRSSAARAESSRVAECPDYVCWQYGEQGPKTKQQCRLDASLSLEQGSTRLTIDDINQTLAEDVLEVRLFQHITAPHAMPAAHRSGARVCSMQHGGRMATAPTQRIHNGRSTFKHLDAVQRRHGRWPEGSRRDAFVAPAPRRLAQTLMQRLASLQVLCAHASRPEASVACARVRLAERWARAASPVPSCP